MSNMKPFWMFRHHKCSANWYLWHQEVGGGVIYVNVAVAPPTSLKHFNYRPGSLAYTQLHKHQCRDSIQSICLILSLSLILRPSLTLFLSISFSLFCSLVLAFFSLSLSLLHTFSVHHAVQIRADKRKSRSVVFLLSLFPVCLFLSLLFSLSSSVNAGMLTCVCVCGVWTQSGGRGWRPSHGDSY